MDKNPNRLINEKSPYLLQHAYNPVNWYPWGDEAFERAKREDKPVFFSSGYSCCHWCHVMERGCFEDQEVANLLNNYFVAIKVDREERPDVDGIYMSVCQALTGQGGWPLTVVMAPDKKPFFAGTYFPKYRDMGRMGLLELLNVLQNHWKNNRGELVKTGEDIVNILQSSKPTEEIDQVVTTELLKQAYLELKNSFDTAYGGFGMAPKFPTPHKMSFLLRYWHNCKEEKALAMVEKTLISMWQGGIYDHVGYGFARYSTDGKWLVPHFEKMLYDNALLCYSYLEAYQCSGNKDFARIAEEILTYVLRDMTDKDGGFYSAEDADSEGVEGKFYVFTRKQVMDILGEEGEIFSDYYRISTLGNFEHGTNILNFIGRNREKYASKVNMTVNELAELLERGRKKLYQVREERIHPYKDDKILTAWNALMISAFAKAARVLNQANYTEIAERGIQFIYDKLMRQDGRLLARYREGEAAHIAYLDDYAFLLMALIEMYETTFKEIYLQRAVKLANDMKKLFWDNKAGGFYFYGTDGETLITRPKEVYDGAIPSGNSVAALALQKLADITGDSTFQGMVKRLFGFFAGEVGRYAAGYTQFMIAIDYYFAGKLKVVIVGYIDNVSTQEMLSAVHNSFLPNTAVRFYDASEQETGGYKMVEGKTTAYVCENFTCRAPITDVEKFISMLRGKNTN